MRFWSLRCKKIKYRIFCKYSKKNRKDTLFCNFFSKNFPFLFYFYHYLFIIYYNFYKVPDLTDPDSQHCF